LIGQGRENAKEYLRDNPDLAFELEMLIRDEYAIMPLGAYADDQEEGDLVIEDDE
jgi:recombination protein RecA